MIVVSDASPLISLAAVGRLGVLRDLYGRVCIPEQVHHEITGRGMRLGAREIADADWIDKVPVSDGRLREVLERSLDSGESEAIALAVELKAELILIDETRARAAAMQLGLNVVGVLGVVALARTRALIPSAREVIEAMRVATGFRIAPALLNDVLASLGEG